MKIMFARAQGERLARELGGEKPPINVEQIARKLGLRVAGAKLGAGVSGLLVTNDEEKCICVQAADSAERKRFTIAHEIGHFQLRHQFAEGTHVHVDHGHLISQRSTRSSQGIDPIEVEANQFAACLLMPSNLLRTEVLQIDGPLRDGDVERLASKFKVSEQAMTIRLSTLRLLG